MGCRILGCRVLGCCILGRRGRWGWRSMISPWGSKCTRKEKNNALKYYVMFIKVMGRLLISWYFGFGQIFSKRRIRDFDAYRFRYIRNICQIFAPKVQRWLHIKWVITKLGTHDNHLWHKLTQQHLVFISYALHVLIKDSRNLWRMCRRNTFLWFYTIVICDSIFYIPS